MRTLAWRIAVVAFILSLLLVVPNPGHTLVVFGDIEQHWAQDTIERWLQEGWVSGYGDETFRPNAPVSRVEFATMTNRALGFTYGVEPPFPDVDEEAWYAEEVSKGIAAGYLSGYPDGTFRPHAPISRAEAASILRVLLDQEKDDARDDGLEAFTDADAVPAWAEEAVAAVAEADIMGGYPDNTFRPDASITRAESVSILDRSLEHIDLGPTLYLGAHEYHPADTVEMATVNLGENPVTVGHPFEIQVREDDQWVDVPLDLAWIMVLEVLEPSEKLEQSFVPQQDFEERDPEPGETYRVRKQVTDDETGEDMTLIATFDIVEPDAGLDDLHIDTLYCERPESLGLEARICGAMPADQSLRIDFSEAAAQGVYFEGDAEDIAVSPAGDISLESTAPPGGFVVVYRPHEDIPDDTVVELEIDPGDAFTPPGTQLGCDDTGAWKESPHEIVFSRTDTGFRASEDLHVAGPVPVTFEVLTETGAPVADATVTVDGAEEQTDADGMAAFSLIPRGYDYRVRAEGYHDVQGGVDVVDEPITREVVLTEKGPGVQTSLDGREYRRDETVTVYSENVGITDVRLGMDSFPYTIEAYRDGEWLEMPLQIATLPAEVVLEPGEVHEARFVPEEAFEEEVVPGRYRVRNEAECLDTGEVLPSVARFTILHPGD